MGWKSAILGGGEKGERLWHDADIDAKRVHLRQYHAYFAGVIYPENANAHMLDYATCEISYSFCVINR